MTVASQTFGAHFIRLKKDEVQTLLVSQCDASCKVGSERYAFWSKLV